VSGQINDTDFENHDGLSDEAFRRHYGPVTCVCGVPSSPVAVTSAYDGAVGLFALDTGEVQLLGYHDHLVNRITVDGTGRRAASSSSDYTIRLWDLQNRRLERVLMGHSDDVEDFAFIGDDLGASVSRDHRILLWNLHSGAIVNVLEGHEKDVLSIVHHDGRIYTSGDDMTLRVWDVNSGCLLQTWGPFDTETDSCAIDPIHGRAVLASDDGVIRVFGIHDGHAITEIEAHASGIKKVATSPRNGDILSAAYDQKIRVWDANDFSEKVELETRAGTWERSFNWSPDGTQVLAGTFDGTVLVWDAVGGRCEAELGERGNGNPCLNDVGSNGEEFVAVSDDGIVRLGRISAGDAGWSDEREPGSGRRLSNAVTFDEDIGVVTGCHDGKLHFFSRSDGRLEPRVEVALGEGPINAIRVGRQSDPAGEVFVACYNGAIVRLDASGARKGTIRVHDGAVKSLALHPHEPAGVSCCAGGTLCSWTLDGELLNRFPGHMAIIDDVDIDPSGRKVASVSRDFTLKVFDFESGRLLKSLSLGRRSPKAMCFLDENTVIVSNYWGALLRIDLDSEDVVTSEIAANGISAVTKHGDSLLAASYDGAIYLVRPDDLSVDNVLRSMTQRLQPSARLPVMHG